MFQYPKKLFALVCSKIVGILMTKNSVAQSDLGDKLGQML